jgi:phospholipase C
MNRRRTLCLASAALGLSALLLSLAACGSSSPSNNGPGYALTAAALNPGSVTAGGASTSLITVTPATGYAGSVNLSCSKITGGSPPPTCAFSVSPITISSATPGTSTLTVSTSSGTPGGTYSITVTGSDGSGTGPSNGPQSLALTTTALIQHVVVIFQENRTTDNLFQDPVLIKNGADIAQSGVNSSGQTITLEPIDLGSAGTNPQNYDLSHAHSAFVSMYDGGKMDGANLIPCNPAANCDAYPNPQFMYVKPSDVQPYFAMAEQYTFGDRMFQTNEGPSFPAHQFIISGTSAPTATSDLFASENMSGAGNAGCIAAATTTVELISPLGVENSSQYPCFEHATLTDLLDAAAISWRYYTPSAGSIWTGPDAIEHICGPNAPPPNATACVGAEWTNNVFIPEKLVLEDINNGQLAQVSWVIPDGSESDHAASNNGSGPSWVASIVNGIGNSPYWANTAIIITWDDWGGWYDHVAPKVVDDGVSWGSGYVYGFRVPLIVVSPYAKAAYISHTTHDFGSILKFIETTYGLPSLNYADAPADDLSDCFNLSQTPITFQTIPAPLDAAHFINDKSPPTDPDDD